MTPESVGFVPGVLNHKLIHSGSSGTGYYQYENFTCTCGMKFNVHLTQKGTANAGQRRSWQEHLASLSTPDEIYAIGSIQKARVRWDIYVFPRSYSGAIDFATASGRWYGASWMTAQPKDGWHFSNCWAVGIHKVHKNSSTKSIHSIYTSKANAVQRGMKILANAEGQGFGISRGESAQLEAPVISPRLSLMEFVTVVDEALESSRLDLVRDTMARLEDFLDALPILEAKRGQLSEHHDKILTLGMDLGIETGQEEASDSPEAVGDQVGVCV